MFMKPQSPIRLLGISIFLMFIFKPLPFIAFAEQENPCLICHVHFKEPSKNIHPALNIGCDACHFTEQGKEHPKDRNSIKLRDDVPALCYNCHKEFKSRGKYIHAPVSEGMCTACHNVHQSDFKSLLIIEPPALCFKCHYKAKFIKKHFHKVALNSCGRRCHDAHASDRPYRLSQDINTTCTGCHSAQESGSHIVSLSNGHIHPIKGFPDPNKPKMEMTCISCHNPHGSNFAKLFSSGKTCKKCHKFY
jgi:predicted CXXCH cytochrome family protein